MGAFLNRIVLECCGEVCPTAKTLSTDVFKHVAKKND
jgi:hypothetical protein